MEYFEESYFREFAHRTPLYEQRTYCEASHGAPMTKTFDIFLSYNIADIDVVKGIYFALSKEGFAVYLDCMVDADLKRNETDEATAKLIQTRLMHCKSLLYAQSPSAGQSNWMPWELGVVDGNTWKCMIMPVTKGATKASPKREYLLLYPYVRPGIMNEMKVYPTKGSVLGSSIKSYIGL